jgi:hypothetical protein
MLAGGPDLSVGSATSLAVAALRYAVRGWAVFPLLPGGKSPLIPKARGGRGFKDATTDLGIVQRWWSRWPDANIGTPTGVRFDVLDVDVKASGDGWGGFELLRRRGLLAGCCGVAQTRNGGAHYLFSPSGLNSRGYGFIDLKGVGGYVVLPPSRVPADVPNGPGRYAWIDSFKPDEGEALNVGLIDLVLRPSERPCRRTTTTPGDLRGLVNAVAAAREGNRNNILFWALCRALDEGRDTTGIEDAARAAGLGGAEIIRTRASAVSRRAVAAS